MFELRKPMGSLRTPWLIAFVALTACAAPATSGPTEPPTRPSPPPPAPTRAPAAPSATPAAVATAPDPEPPAFPTPMVEIPKGKFTMGCEGEGCADDEQPRHQVLVSAFAIDTHEVTVGHYLACVDVHHCLPLDVPPDVDGEDAAHCRRQLRPAHRRWPVTCVPPFQADKYCEWRGKRLPTEAEWERAARGDDERAHPWGDAPLEAGHACLGDTPCDVGVHPDGDSPLGVHDLLGNAAEWVIDGYHPAFYARSPARDPDGFQDFLPERHRRCGNISCRVARGGSWRTKPDALHVTDRHPHRPMGKPWEFAEVGFRCAESRGKRLREPCTRCRADQD